MKEWFSFSVWSVNIFYAENIASPIRTDVVYNSMYDIELAGKFFFQCIKIDIVYNSQYTTEYAREKDKIQK